jgi:branched-subunit amino acid aminotransferase/4-amino-4-deoxychorismate lyase
MADYAAYFGGQWMPFSEVRIDPLDRGFLVGDCVFDVARTFNGDGQPRQPDRGGRL